MSSTSFRIGVASVNISQPVSTSLPSLSTLVFTCSSVTPTSVVINDLKKPLAATNTYQVMLGLLGNDTTFGGYTIGYCSPGSGNLSITAGQGIQITVPNANWPANFQFAAAVAIFLKVNNGLWQLAQYAYLDTNNDFNTTVVSLPVPAAPSFTAAILESTTQDTAGVLGSRTPTGYQFFALSPTTKGVQVTRQVSSVTVSPDTAADFTITTTRTAEIAFQLLPNEIVNVVEGNAGDYVLNTGTAGVSSQGQMSIYTASAIIPGNAPMKLFMPLSASGAQEVRLYLGQLLRNQSQNNESWTKTDTTPIQYTFSAAPIDSLLNNMATEVLYRLG